MFGAHPVDCGCSDPVPCRNVLGLSRSSFQPGGCQPSFSMRKRNDSLPSLSELRTESSRRLPGYWQKAVLGKGVMRQLNFRSAWTWGSIPSITPTYLTAEPKAGGVNSSSMMKEGQPCVDLILWLLEYLESSFKSLDM